MQITAELVGQIHAAMERGGGSATKAADLLGMDRRKLCAFIHNNNELKLRWARSKEEVAPPGDAVSLHRPTFPMLNEELETAKAMDKEDALVRQGLDAIGVEGEALELAMALQAFQHRHFSRAIEMLGGGITKQFLDLMVEVKDIGQKLHDPNYPLDPEKEADMREDRRGLLQIMGQYYDRGIQALLIQAKVRAMQNQAEGRGKPGKPGFTPLVAVQGTNVTISQPPK